MGYVMVGKVLFHIGCVAADKATGELVMPYSEKADKTNVLRRIDDFTKCLKIERQNEN